MLMHPSKSRNEKGQGLVEYALILALVAIVVIGVVAALGNTVSAKFSDVSTALDGSIAEAPENAPADCQAAYEAAASLFNATVLPPFNAWAAVGYPGNGPEKEAFDEAYAAFYASPEFAAYQSACSELES